MLVQGQRKEMGGEILWKSEESCGNMVVESAGLCYNSEERNCRGYGLNGRRMVSFRKKLMTYRDRKTDKYRKKQQKRGGCGR